ncbi:MAG: hypothetical protein V1918_10655 [Planctomycetota bacterium]
MRIGDEVIQTRIPCVYLDTRTKLCTIYGERRVKNPRCLTVEGGILARAFPADCPYVRGLAGYRPPLPPERLADFTGHGNAALPGEGIFPAR